MFQLIIKEAADRMLDDAYWWYEQQLPGLGERLFSEVEICFEKLRQHPTYYSEGRENYRQIIVKNFPYKIIFEIIETDVIVYSIFHTSRNPDNLFG
ncbi:MAG: type toxin-antitoxin system RelE/ParE family toxin [Flavipsychrobacter sp.]|jgi:plasmid stabilization system protein ParE|nr:type toxin-antitoxin system RelE/ParE family toxin [Flavipsychrobacter sp.]